MFEPGDKVFIELSAQDDVSFRAWDYIKNHLYATVKAKMQFGSKPAPILSTSYALEWPEEFDGGIDCYGKCLPRRGQFIECKHLSLDFENSRNVITVPNIEHRSTNEKSC